MEWFGYLFIDNDWLRVTGPHPGLGECSRETGRIARDLGVLDRDTCMTHGAKPGFRPRGIKETNCG